MSVKCEEPIDELAVQVWLLYHNPNFNYCTLYVSGTELWTDKRTDRQTNRQTDDLITRCPRRTFQAGGIKTSIADTVDYNHLDPPLWRYAKSQLLTVCSDLHLVTYLDVGKFCDKSTETTSHEICVQVFLRFSDSSKPSQSVYFIYELAWLAGIHKSEENLLKTSCKVAPVTKVAHIF